MITRVNFWDDYEFTLYMIFAILLKMAIPILAIFVKMYPSYHSRDFAIKNDNQGFKTKAPKFLGIQPTYCVWGWVGSKFPGSWLVWL